MKKLSMGIPNFNKMSHRTSLKQPYSQFTSMLYLFMIYLGINPKLPPSKWDIVPMAKTTGRDMRMYKMTEAFENIINDNEKLDYIKKIWFSK